MDQAATQIQYASRGIERKSIGIIQPQESQDSQNTCMCILEHRGTFTAHE